LRGEWVERDSAEIAQLEVGYPLQIDRHGFCVIELRRSA
jgi:hypothetical protein